MDFKTNPIEKKAKQWIKNGKDPRSAHWQAGLEAMFEVFKPYLEPGKLLPVQALENEDIPVYEAILATADLSPGLLAAFLPPAIADKIKPPESAEELLRVEDKKPSYKILILRPDKEPRIMCAEISPHAQKPGADIFQAGALLGSYDYPTFEECITGLTQTIRAHLWQKGKWPMDDHRRYTQNWFKRVMELQNKAVQVEQNFSYLHSPTLIKADKIDAIFTLIFNVLDERLMESSNHIKDMQNTQQMEFLEGAILECLNIMRKFEHVHFSELSDTENDQFKREFSNTLKKITNKINK